MFRSIASLILLALSSFSLSAIEGDATTQATIFNGTVTSCVISRHPPADTIMTGVNCRFLLTIELAAKVGDISKEPITKHIAIHSPAMTFRGDAPVGRSVSCRITKPATSGRYALGNLTVLPK